MPPVTTSSCSPARIIRSAISIARIDDAQTLLIVSAGVSFGKPGADRRLPRRRLPDARLEHLAHDHVLGLPGLEADTLERRADHVRAELRRLEVLEAAAELAERRPDGGDDDGAGHGIQLIRRRVASRRRDRRR